VENRADERAGWTNAAANGVRLAYSDIGHGIPLICLHGGMGVDSTSLRVPGVLDLAGFGIRLVIPDQRGHGRSSRSTGNGYTHDMWAADVHHLARVLELRRFALLGHSYGGFLALEYAKRWPESLTHLILVATSAGPISARVADVSTDVDLREHFRRVWPQFFFGANKHWPLLESLQFSAEAYRAAFARELPSYDVRDAIPDLRVPTLLIVGRQDSYLPDMQWLAANLPSATLCILNEVGHFPFIEAAELFTERVAAFLTGAGL
jgi:proline iminopeptidase